MASGKWRGRKNSVLFLLPTMHVHASMTLRQLRAGAPRFAPPLRAYPAPLLRSAGLPDTAPAASLPFVLPRTCLQIAGFAPGGKSDEDDESLMRASRLSRTVLTSVTSALR